MFGYVLPPLDALPQEETQRFRAIYCGLCHTLRRRYGWAARFILNYDFTFLAMLLSDPQEPLCREGRCIASPVRKRCYAAATPALELAADESVILTYWQLRDGIADHSFFKGLKYRLAAGLLRRAYRKACGIRPAFDEAVRRQLTELAALEKARCASIDAAADPFARLLAAAADAAGDPTQRRILQQILYHLGRWVYLIDAADDLDEDRTSGSYNPLLYRYGPQTGRLEGEDRRAFAATLDQSIRMIEAAFELWDFGCWHALLESTFYAGLFQVGKAVLDGTFQSGLQIRKKEKTRLLRDVHE